MTFYNKCTNTMYATSLLRRTKVNRLYGHKCNHVKATSKDEYENYQVFQHKHIVFSQSVDVHEVDDHLEAVTKLKKEDKSDHFMSHGLDYDRCYEYINVVKYLNRCWKSSHNHEYNVFNKTKFIDPCSTVICVIAFIYHYVKDGT